MAQPQQSQLAVLPHEWAFNALLLSLALRLVSHAGFGDFHALQFAACCGGGIAVGAWAARRPSPARWRLRLLWYPLMMGLTFYSLPAAIRTLGVPPADALLARWDLALLGAPATQYFAVIQTPWLTELMVAAYLFFFYYLVFGPAHYCIGDLPRFRACFAGLFTLYALGFLGYTLLPAGGPHEQAGLPPLPGGRLAHWLLPLVDAGSNQVDVFPSIHAAASLFLLLFDAWYFRARFRLLWLPTAALWLSTVYLRYHYVVDLAAGLALALAALAVARAYERSALAQAIDERERQFAREADPQPGRGHSS